MIDSITKIKSLLHHLLMKIATYNINGINGRLRILPRWLSKGQPAIVCLQDLKQKREISLYKQYGMLVAGGLGEGIAMFKVIQSAREIFG